MFVSKEKQDMFNDWLDSEARKVSREEGGDKYYYPAKVGLLQGMLNAFMRNPENALEILEDRIQGFSISGKGAESERMYEETLEQRQNIHEYLTAKGRV